MSLKVKKSSLGIVILLLLIIALPIVIFSTQQQVENQQHASYQNLNSADLISQTNNEDGTMGSPDSKGNYANILTASQTGTLTFLVTDPVQAKPTPIVDEHVATSFGELLQKKITSPTHSQSPATTAVSLQNVVQTKGETKGETGLKPVSTEINEGKNNLLPGGPQAVSSLEITISKVEAHIAQVVVKGDTVATWETLNIGVPKTTDLVQLAKGDLASLGLTKLAAGQYSEVRLYITKASAKLPDGTVIPLAIPGKFTIVRVVHSFTIVAGQNTNLTIDFDAQNSVLKVGDSYMLKPVVANFLESR